MVAVNYPCRMEGAYGAYGLAAYPQCDPGRGLVWVGNDGI